MQLKCKRCGNLFEVDLTKIDCIIIGKAVATVAEVTEPCATIPHSMQTAVPGAFGSHEVNQWLSRAQIIERIHHVRTI